MTNSFPIPQQMKSLEGLQELDLKIDQLKKAKAALPVALQAADTELSKANAAVDAKKKLIEEAEKALRQSRAAMDLNRDREGRSASRLEAVRNSQEFQAVNKEVDQLKKLNTTLGEQIKKSEQEIEAATTQLKALEGKVTESQTARESQATQLSGESQSLDAQINELVAQRKQFTPNVDPRVLAQYDRVRVARNGLGISPAAGGRCKACNMMVPPQMFNEILQNKGMHQCPSCYRLLYVSGQ